MQQSEKFRQLAIHVRQSYTPSFEIARFALGGYIRSGWILLEIILVWFIYSVFFSTSKLSAHAFFDIAIPCMTAETILGSSIIVHRCMKANFYLSLARLSSRAPYIYGIIIASASIRIILYLLLLLTMISFKNIVDISWLNILSGSLGLLLIGLLCSLLTVTLSRPIATRPAQIIFLLWIVIVLYTNTPAAINIAHYLQIFEFPLRPIALCYQLSSQGSIDAWGWGGAIIVLVYMVAITTLATFWFSKRDLYLT
jgi:hypothetical protein